MTRFSPARPAAKRLRGRCRTSRVGPSSVILPVLQDDHAVGQHQASRTSWVMMMARRPARTRLRSRRSSGAAWMSRAAIGSSRSRNLGVGGERPGHRHALRLAAGQLRRPPGLRGQWRPPRPASAGPFPARLSLGTRRCAARRPRFPARSGAETAAAPGPAGRCRGGAGRSRCRVPPSRSNSALAVDLGPAGVRAQQAGNDSEQRGFPGAVGTQHGHAFRPARGRATRRNRGQPRLPAT